MAEQVLAEVAGLQISNNTFSGSPPGSLLVADNCVMPQKGVIEPRRGQNRYTTPTSATQIPFALTEFNGVIIGNFGTSKTDTSYELAKCDTDPVTAFSGGPYNPVDNTSTAGRMKFAQAAGYLYFCTTTGPKCVETTSSTPRSAGLLRMPDVVARMVSLSVESHGWLPYGASVAYRALLRKPTSDGVSMLSPPSGRTVVTNRIYAPVGAMVRTGGATVTVTIPGQSLAGGTGFGLAVGDTFTLTPGEANFPAGSYTVASTSGIGVFTYASAGANVSNTVGQDFDTGPRAVHTVVAFSSDATTSTPWRLYRSLATSTSTIVPSDELYLVNEAFPTAGQITAGEVAYNDTTPESVIADPLYTNPQTGEGPTQANCKPPIYRDIANFAARTWYANTTARQQMRLQMLGVGAPDGVQANDTITINQGATAFTITFKATASIVTESSIVSDSDPSINILRTTQNLIAALNNNFAANNLALKAYYDSSEDGAPGAFLIEATDFSSTVFQVKASRPATWTPALQSASYVDSVAERVPNGLAYSKLAQPEAVPPVNFLNIGSKSYPIRRIIGLQNSLLVFKDGDGVYSVSGNYPFQVLQISSANILAPDACCMFADNAWAYTDQGILRITDAGGATVVSRPIETELNQLYGELQNETAAWSFMVPYETERRLMLFVPFELSDVSPFRPVMKAYCYNNATNSWSGPLYVDAFSGNVATSVNKLSLGIYDYAWTTGRVTLERRQADYRDYADANFNVTVSAVDGLVLTLSDVTDVEAGDGILRSSGWRSVIYAMRPDLGATCVEVYEEGCTTGSATIHKHYDVEAQFQPSGNPSARKTLTRLTWLMKPSSFMAFDALTLLLTDQIQANEEVATPSVGFGYGPFGTGPFGNPTPLVVDVNPLDAARTNAAQFFPGLRTSEAWARFRLQGFAALIETQGAPMGRGK